MSLTATNCNSDTNTSNIKRIELEENWTFNMEGSKQVYKATVPGTVHTDLLSARAIPEPFFRENEKLCQWVDKKNWVYKTKFYVDSADLAYSAAYIHFKGLDTYAEVKLNGKPILTANNMFRSWKAHVKKELVKGENTLEIRFVSPVEIGLKKLDKFGYALPADNDQSVVGGLGDKKISVFTRKAPYHYGWDWGPRLVTSGIWRPVELCFIDKAEICDVYIDQKSVSSEEAQIYALVNLDNYQAGQYKLEISDGETGEKYATEKFDLHPDDTTVSLGFTINKPRLWWPNGYGRQNLYRFKATLFSNGKVADTKSTTTGLREIKVIREADSAGKSFYFEVNGTPVFAKGANYIPGDNFLTRVDTAKYEYLVKSAANANMNMLRVWGGGIYENDFFYELCDKYGILIWQDFMFACSMYPGNNYFIENVRLEAIENIVRLRNYACLALWCGNNEIDIAWCNANENCGWGWKQKYSPEQRKQIWQAYDTLFLQVLPDVVKNYDANKFYWPSSPLSEPGYGTNSGDVHYWGVWHGGEPFEKFETVKARFMSEYGFQSFPEINTIKEFTLPEDSDIYSDVMLSHQRSGIGNQKIKEYLEMYYPLPRKFDDFLYVGQLLQAYGIKKAIDCHRIDKPYCMGTLYWQLNDCWPGASWSSIDYYGNWKALQYKAKHAFEPLRIAVLQDKSKIELYVLNDIPSVSKGTLNLKIIGFDGKIYYETSFDTAFTFEKSTLIFQIDLQKLPVQIPVESSLLLAGLKSGDIGPVHEIHYFLKPKELRLPPLTLTHKLTKKDAEYVLELEAVKLAKDVAIHFPGIRARYSNNYFDLLPGEKTQIIIRPNNKSVVLTQDDIVVQTLNNIEK